MIEIWGQNEIIEAIGQMNPVAGTISVIIFGALFPALGEELLFRGYIGRGLVARWGMGKGVLLTSLLFGAVHIHPLHAVVAAFLGVILHALYLWTRSLIVPMLLHGINNYAAIQIPVSAKHGQSPSDHSLLVKNGDTLTALLEANNYLDPNGMFGQAATTSGNPNDGSGLVATGVVQTDDVGLIWLRDPSQAAVVVATLQANLGCVAPGICADGPSAHIFSGTELKTVFGDPAAGRTPDDSHIALLVSMPGVAAQTNSTAVVSTQVAPTILTALKLDPTLLNAVQAEGTQALPGLGF